MSLAAPIWLLLAVPMALAWWQWRGPTVPMRVLRALVLLLVVVAMAEPTLRLPERAGTVVVVADRSRSMPADAEARQREVIELLQQAMGPRHRLAVVSFGQRVAVERQPDVGAFAGFVQSVDGDGSDLASAIDRALGLVPPDGAGRLLVLSDGLWTGRDPQAEAGRAAGREVPIDHRLLTRSRVNDVAVQRVEAPHRLSEGDSFLLHGWVQSPVAQTLRYELRRGEQVLSRGERDVPAGLSRLTFRDRAASAGVRRYRLHVTADGADPVPENNTARALVDVEGRRPLLVVTDAPEPALARLLEAGGLAVQVRQPEQVDWSLTGLSGYGGLVVENVPANRIVDGGLERVAAWVNDLGGGLMLTGGQRSFGPGGYFESPVDALLPVSMELRQEHRKMSLAVAVVLDRSGSMSMAVGGGRTKMDLANLGTAKVLEMLTPMDEFGVVAVDTSAHTIVPLQDVPGDPASMRDRVLRIASMGGGIYIEEALVAAGRMLAHAEASTRHIILFSDAQDSVNPGRYREIVREFERANITVSVIGLGQESDIHAELLKDIARRGDGRIFFTQDATRLPELFAQDMFVVARSSFIDVPTPVRTTAGITALLGRSLADPPPVGGYNLTYLRPGATLGMHTQDEYEAPFVAAWQAGLGRTAVYTGEADGAFTGPIADWPAIGELLTSLARWTAGETDALPPEMMLTQRIERGIQFVELHVDSRWAATGLRQTPTVTTLRDADRGELTTHDTAMRWVSADRLVAEVPLHGEDPAMSVVHIPGHGDHRLAPVQLPYSPEYLPAHETGQRALAQLARATGGQERVSVAELWESLPRLPRLLPVGHWLLLTAIVLLVMEVLERRTGVLGRVRSLRRRQRAAGGPATTKMPDDAPVAARPPARPAQARPSAADDGRDTPPAPPAESASPPPADDLASALAQARRRASHRQGRR